MCNVGVHGDWNSMLSKNEMLLDWFDDQLAEHRDDLVIVVDSADVVFGGCEIDGLLAAYKRNYGGSGGLPVVVFAELGLFPTGEKYQTHRYADLRARRRKVMNASGLADDTFRAGNSSRCLSANASSCSTWADYEFMNYGFLIGPVGALHALLSFVVKTVPPGFLDNMKGFLDPTKRVQESNDQGIAAMYMFDHPDEVTLDYFMTLTASMHDMPRDLLEIKDGRVWNKVTRHEQCFIHFNGNSRAQLGDLRERLKTPVVVS